MTVKDQNGSSLPRLVAVMQRLLGEGGCPWDREQTFKTLRKYVVEEAHEVADAMDGLGDDGAHPQGPARVLTADDRAVRELREELGDLLLQVVFQSELARSRGWFGPDDVVAAIADKMERRHPHVFGEVSVSGAAEVLTNWERLKAKEKSDKGLLSGTPKGLPALSLAARYGEKAANVGFDWPDARGPREKIDEELRELDEAVASGDPKAVEHELGDVLFSVVNHARKLGLDPEAALASANRRFRERFAHVERAVNASGKGWEAHTPEQLDAHWVEAKRVGPTSGGG